MWRFGGNEMSDLMEADAWMHMVLSSSTSLDICEKKFQEFTLMQDIFIRDEIQNNIIPDLERRGYVDSVKAYKQILAVLENVMAEK